MDSREFENLQNKIKTLKEKQAKATGALESIVAGWKEKYKVSTVEEVEALLAEKKAEVAETEELIESQYKALRGLTNWGLV